MYTFSYIYLIFLSGLISGLIFSLLLHLFIEPYIDKAIDIEISKKHESIDINQLNSYRAWQKNGSILGSILLYVGYSCILGFIYPYARKRIKGSEAKRGLIIAIILWIAIFLVPFIKYPANPPAVGDPNTIYYRQALYLAIIGISSSTALFLAYLSKRINSRVRFVLIPIYIGVIAVAYLFLPDNPDKVSIDSDILINFRISSLLSSLVTWISLGVIFGLLYDRFIVKKIIKDKEIN